MHEVKKGLYGVSWHAVGAEHGLDARRREVTRKALFVAGRVIWLEFVREAWVRRDGGAVAVVACCERVRCLQDEELRVLGQHGLFSDAF